jgi:hypothetical protein
VVTIITSIRTRQAGAAEWIEQRLPWNLVERLSVMPAEERDEFRAQARWALRSLAAIIAGLISADHDRRRRVMLAVAMYLDYAARHEAGMQVDRPEDETTQA